MLHLKRPTKQTMTQAWIMAEAALGYLISIMISGVYLARITTALGFSDSLTGVISSFLSLGCLMQMASVVLFKNMRSPRRMCVVCFSINELMYAIAFVTPALNVAPVMKVAIFLFCFLGANVMGNVMSATKTDWTLSMIDDRVRGRFTAKNEMISLLSGMLFNYLMGAMVDSFDASGNGRLVYIVGFGIMIALSVFRTLSIAAVEDKPCTPRVNVKLKDTLKGLMGDKAVRRMVLVCVIWHVASSCAVPFYGAYQLNELGFSMRFVSVLSIIYSVVRIAASPLLGRYADKKSFAHMSFICFLIVGAGFLVNIFTVPANGKVMFTAYYCLYAIAMGGINGALTNLVFENVKGDNRRDALAINAALGGIAGFATTCLMSPVVAHIQSNGNTLFGVNMYAAQFCSAAAFVLIAGLAVYMRLVVIPGREKKEI